jgi:ribosomal protein S12 methylthiotransferase
MDIQNNINYEKNSAMVGQTQKVIIDEVGATVAVGRTEYDSPEIDNIVRVDGKVSKGDFYNVKINNFNEYELIGSV